MSGTDRFHKAATRWLLYAQEDLQAGKEHLEKKSGVPRHVCWLVQQAAEKAMKALLVLWQIDFPKTHDLQLLSSLLPESGRPPDYGSRLAELSEWAVEARYPGDWPEATWEDAAAAVDVASSIVIHTVGIMRI